MRYFKRHWNEVRGDAHSDWGTSTWYFEADQDLTVTRQIEIYLSGTVLHYDRQNLHDEFGSLADQPLDASDFGFFAIEQAEFEQTWSSRKPLNR